MRIVSSSGSSSCSMAVCRKDPKHIRIIWNNKTKEKELYFLCESHLELWIGFSKLDANPVTVYFELKEIR